VATVRICEFVADKLNTDLFSAMDTMHRCEQRT